MAASAGTIERDLELATLLGHGGIRAVYQPIVDLDSFEPVAYEALARGPAGSALEMPRELFAAARLNGTERQLDRAARRAAIAGAIEANLPEDVSLFVNVEPSTLDEGGPLLADDEQRHRNGLRLIVEFTERDLTHDPASVIRAVHWLREHGCGIALDDIGVDRRSLALLPFVAPDVMKLDMSIIQRPQLDRSSAHVVNAIAAEAERSGALLLAEGIETEAHLARALSFGATLGQGWYFGRPEDLPNPVPSNGRAVSLRESPLARNGHTPFDVLADERPPRLADKRVLLALSHQLESEAADLGAECVVLATFQRGEFFSSNARRRYEELAQTAALVGGLGIGIGSSPARGVRGGNIAAGDPLASEWDVVIISPFFAGAFVARDLGDAGNDLNRRFEFCISYDREIVIDVARILMSRILPTGPMARLL